MNKTKKIGLISATALGISAIMGSGWLFAPSKAVMVAGPAAILSWIIAAFIIVLLGLCFSEIAALYPRRGLTAIIPILSHNKYFAFPFAIINWLSIIATVALEADATLEYLINLVPHFKTLFYLHNQLTLMGDAVSIALVFGFGLVNYWGATTLTKTNNIFAVIKIIIPVFIALVLITTVFHPANFTIVHHSFAPYGYQAVFTAILTSGIIVSFNGFQTVVSFASEVKDASRTIPLSIVIATGICLAIYLLLQVAFIGAMPLKIVQQGWNQLSFSAPLAQILGLVGLGIFSTVTYFGATVAPSGAGIALLGTGSRMFTAMSRHDQMPSYFSKMHPRFGISRRSLIFNTLVGVVFLLLFRSWSSLAEVLGLLHVLSYLPVPIAMWVLRDKIERRAYPFRIPLGKVIALLLFLFFTYLCVLTDFTIISEIVAMLAIFLLLFIAISSRSIKHTIGILKNSWSVILYFVVLIILARFSPSNSTLFSDIQFAVVVVLTTVGLFGLMIMTKRPDVMDFK